MDDLKTDDETKGQKLRSITSAEIDQLVEFCEYYFFLLSLFSLVVLLLLHEQLAMLFLIMLRNYFMNTRLDNFFVS